MMTNLKWLILAGLLLSVLRLDAQTVVGQVADEQGQPLPYANVALLTLPDSAFVAGSITDEQGHFMLKDVVPSGLVRISSVGYVTVYKETRADIGVIIMQPDAHMLQEVVVRSRLPVTRISGDALVTTVQGSVLAEAGSAGDVLARIPAVIRRDDAFEVFGKGAPLIYINGRKVRSMDELEQLNSSDIRQVKVVTNPGARYDASVKSVIRIRTVKRKGDGFGFDVRSTYSYAEKSQWHEQANLNYRHDDLDIFGSLTYRRNVRLQDSHISQETQADALWQQENTMNNESLSERVEAVTGWNYAFGREHSLGMRYSLRAMPKDCVLSGITSRVWQGGAFYDNWTSHSRNEGDHRPTHQLNVYYSGKAGRLSIDWDADYYGGKSNTRNFTHEDSQEQESREKTVHAVGFHGFEGFGNRGEQFADFHKFVVGEGLVEGICHEDLESRSKRPVGPTIQAKCTEIYGEDMALIMFSCRATGPFIIFEDVVRKIFKEIGEPWRNEGAWSAEELPDVLRRLNEVSERDKERFRQSEAARDSERRTASFEEEERMDEEDRQNARKEIVQLFQRMQPLRSMIERAIRHEEPVMWGKPH